MDTGREMKYKCVRQVLEMLEKMTDEELAKMHDPNWPPLKRNRNESKRYSR